MSTLSKPDIMRDLTPMQPDVWEVWSNNLSIIGQNSPAPPSRAFVGKDRYDRMMRTVPEDAWIKCDTKLRSPYIMGLLIVIDYTDRERLDFQ